MKFAAFLVSIVLIANVGVANAEDLCGRQFALRFAGKDPREGIYSGTLDLVGASRCAGIAIEEFTSDGATVVYFTGPWSNQGGSVERFNAKPSTNFQFNFNNSRLTVNFDLEGKRIQMRWRTDRGYTGRGNFSKN
jgi:hypothetical protein